jgi:hypothetical protein
MSHLPVAASLVCTFALAAAATAGPVPPASPPTLAEGAWVPDVLHAPTADLVSDESSVRTLTPGHNSHWAAGDLPLIRDDRLPMRGHKWSTDQPVNLPQRVRVFHANDEWLHQPPQRRRTQDLNTAVGLHRPPEGPDAPTPPVVVGAVVGGSGNDDAAQPAGTVEPAMPYARSIILTLNADVYEPADETVTLLTDGPAIREFPEAVAVPLPAAAWAGLATLAGLGVLKLRK